MDLLKCLLIVFCGTSFSTDPAEDPADDSIFKGGDVWEGSLGFSESKEENDGIEAGEPMAGGSDVSGGIGAELFEVILEEQVAHDQKFASFMPDLLQADGAMVETMPDGSGDVAILYIDHCEGYDEDRLVHFRHQICDVEGRPDLMVEYMSNCYNKIGAGNSRVHRLYLEYHFAKVAGDLGIGPKVLFVSPPAELPKQYSSSAPKLAAAGLGASFNFWRYRVCSASPHLAQIRFMVSEWILYDMHDVVDREVVGGFVGGRPVNPVKKFLPLLTVLNFGVSAIGLLRVWHQNGFVHGSVSLASFVTNEPDDREFTNLKLTKFWTAGYAVSAVFESPLGQPSTPWGISENPSCRSDIFRLLVLMGRLAQPYLVGDKLPLPSSSEETPKFYKKGFLFHSPGCQYDSVTSVPHLDRIERDRVRKLLSETTDFVRNLGTLDCATDAPHNRIEGYFHAVMEVIETASDREAPTVWRMIGRYLPSMGLIDEEYA